MDTHEGNPEFVAQSFQDSRSVNFDQRSVNIEQHVHNPDPAVVGHLAAVAASNELRAEATQVVANVREAALQETNATRIEAAREIASARIETTTVQAAAEVARVGALAEVQQLRQQLESSQRENHLLRLQVESVMNSLSQDQHQEAFNATGFQQIDLRLQRIELQITRVEQKLDTHQDYIQELWLHQPPVPEVQQVGGNTPVVRMNDDGPKGFDLCGDNDDDQEDAPSPQDIESRCLRTKDLHHLKLPQLPESASQYRSWRNSVRTMLLSYDQSQEGLLHQWLTPAFTARGAQSDALRNDSGDFPRLDRVLASVLCRQDTLRTAFGLRIQSYVEACEGSGHQIRGRYILNLVAREYDVSAASGAITSSLELFQLPIPQDSAAALKQWRDKAVYILSQLQPHQRPNEELMSQWIYTTLKKHPLMRRVMDRYMDSPLGSHERSFDGMWQGVERAILEAQHDANAQSIRDDLKRGPQQPPPKKTNAMTGAKDKGKGKADKGGTKKTDSTSNPSGKGSNNPKNQKDDKAKNSPSKDANANSGNKVKPLTPAEKAASPCIYHARGRCMRGDQCPYSHSQPVAKAKANPSTSALGAKVPAAVAILTSTVTAAVATSSSTCLEFVGDTGAGECLGSVEAFRRQGLDLPDDFVVSSATPLNFLTGGGTKAGNETVGMWSSEFERLHNVYLLPNCPLALSIGQLCEQDGYTFLWRPSHLPMLIPPSSTCEVSISGDAIQANRVEHNVPIFRMSLTPTYGLPSQVDVPVGGGSDVAASFDTYGVPSKSKAKSEPGPAPSAGGSGPDPALDAGREVDAIEDLQELHDAAQEGQSRDGKGESVEHESHEDEMVDGISSNHLMTHLPKSRSCDTCKRAKLYELPHRRAGNQSEHLRDIRAAEAPTNYLDKLSVDHIVTREEVGFRGEGYTFVMVDQFTGLTSLVPCRTKSSEEIEMALRRLVGRRRPGVIQIASDRAPEIKRACVDLGFSHEPAPPYQRVHNAIAESTIRTIKGMTASILLHSGLDHQYWPLAQSYLEWAYNITTDRYKNAFGYELECFMVPFGALVWFKDPNPMSYGPKGEPALFLGAEIIDGFLFKGNYRVWPLETFKHGVFKEFVTRTLAIPNGAWQFPAVMKEVEPGLEQIAEPEVEEYEYEPSLADDVGQLERELDPLSEFLDPGHGEDSPASSAGAKPKVDESAKSKIKSRRHRSITDIRIAVYGKTPGCGGCSEGTYSHTPECRKRFDELLDEMEPAKVAKKSGDDHLALTSPITGRALQETDLERGHDAVAAIYLQAIEEGFGDESILASKLGMVMQNMSEPKTKRPNVKKKWFVEYCCTESSSCCIVAEACGIPYLGLTESFGDLTDRSVFDQVQYWFQEVISKGEAIDLWGSIPYAPDSTLQQLNRADHKQLERKRQVTEVLLDHFSILSELAVKSGGSVSFEWPLRNRGWSHDKLTQLISKHSMFSCYPSGCGMGLEIDGKFPLKEWRIISTNKRLAAHLDRFRCNHPPNHQHDTIEGDYRSDVYNTKMAVAILSGLNPQAVVRDVPQLPVVHGAIAHEQKGVVMAQLLFGMVHAPLSRSELLNHPEGRQKIMEEANNMRNIPVWGEGPGDLFEVEELKRISREKGETIHLAELMAIGSIKHAESADRALLKVRLVYRGDDTRDQNGQVAVFRELKSLPATVSTINLVLWYGLRKGHCIRIADACKAYLQAPIRSGAKQLGELLLCSWANSFFSAGRIFFFAACRLLPVRA
eukprot:s1190_g32.t1